MATATAEHYRAYAPKPFTRAERDSTTILFGGLHWRLERVLQAVLENGGHHAQVLPVATREDLLTGREVADIGQCCPTSFTTGNLVNFLKKKSGEIGAAEVSKKYVYLTAGSCGACRFGQYHQSYELALRNSGLDAFRMFLMAQDQMDQKAAMGDGIDLDLPMTLGCLWGIFCTDLVQDLEYQVRPYEVVPGQTNAVVKECVELLYEGFRERPRRGPYASVGRHLTTSYFTRIMRAIHGKFSSDYLLRVGLQRFEDYAGIERTARLRLAAGRAVQWVYRRAFDGLRHALGDLTHELPPQLELRRLAAPYFHSRLDGGEGDMLVGKAIWAHQRKKAHMTCELSPYSCMPNTMSTGAMAGVLGKHPDILYAPLEIKGDAEVHALSRCQMILTEAKKRAQRELDDALARTGLTLGDVRAHLDAHPEMKRATYRVPHGDAVGVAANLVLHVAARTGRRAAA